MLNLGNCFDGEKSGERVGWVSELISVMKITTDVKMYCHSLVKQFGNLINV